LLERVFLNDSIPPIDLELRTEEQASEFEVYTDKHQRFSVRIRMRRDTAHLGVMAESSPPISDLHLFPDIPCVSVNPSLP
tara:strand:+ start:417 stop:656 length:240 start_codon:yes stop_codon:yes gene_type:complete